MAATFGFLLGFPGIAATGGSGHRHPGVWRDHPHPAQQHDQPHRRPNGISGIPKPTLAGLEFNRTVKDGGFGTFHDYFGIAYNAKPG
ncbi:hypothetical protein ACLK1W_18115 [Escherichia coli]